MAIREVADRSPSCHIGKNYIIDYLAPGLPGTVYLNLDLAFHVGYSSARNEHSII